MPGREVFTWQVSYKQHQKMQASIHSHQHCLHQHIGQGEKTRLCAGHSLQALPEQDPYPLFCYADTSEDILSLRTTNEYGVALDTRNRNITLTDVQGYPINVLGSATFYMQIEELVRPLQVTFFEMMSIHWKNGKLLLQHLTKPAIKQLSAIH